MTLAANVQSNNVHHQVTVGILGAQSEWVEDRWLLSLLFQSRDGAWQTFAKPTPSLTGLAHGEARGPALNPVFQQCFARVTDAGEGEILLVGQGESHRHYSAVFALNERGARFEVADRCTAGSTPAAGSPHESEWTFGWEWEFPYLAKLPAEAALHSTIGELSATYSWNEPHPRQFTWQTSGAGDIEVPAIDWDERQHRLMWSIHQPWQKPSMTQSYGWTMQWTSLSSESPVPLGPA